MDDEEQKVFDGIESRESNARSYCRKFPMVIKSAKGLYFESQSGVKYLDCLSNAGTLALGHNHDVLVDAATKFFSEQRPWQTLDFATVSKAKFMDAIFRALPQDMQSFKIQFCSPSGSDCVEGAIKLAKATTGRSTICCFSGAYHGMGHGAMSVTGSSRAKAAVPNLMAGVHVFPYPYEYRSPFGIGGKVETQTILTYIENALDDPESGITKPAAFILEAVQGAGGVIPAPIEFLKGIRRITKERDILLVMDEIQSGWGRTGKMFGFQWGEIIPDIVTMSKASGGGQPVAFFIFKKDLDIWKPGTHGGTFRGNQLAMEMGAATINFLIDNDMPKHVREVGACLFDGLLALKRVYPCVGDVRGRGLMLGVELVDTTAKANKLGSYPPHRRLVLLVQQHCFKNHMILGKGGRNAATLRFLPPLIATKKDIAQYLQILETSLKAALAQLENEKEMS
eukprot:TRINITY_DN3265_c0_g1_i2.p1 TRINITY_DN3265_c0_g1~~TRINITY_DN3265_c0_g1_i2.p1  ORF type:complete len:453 (+),score=65.81 TRINITY_DN3265_c0_g1_i2:92-1450(+)